MKQISWKIPSENQVELMKRKHFSWARKLKKACSNFILQKLRRRFCFSKKKMKVSKFCLRCTVWMVIHVCFRFGGKYEGVSIWRFLIGWFSTSICILTNDLRSWQIRIKLCAGYFKFEFETFLEKESVFLCCYI